MQALPYLLSRTADELLKAAIVLQQTTHETWTVDWERFALVCKHGVAVTHWSTLAKPAAMLNAFVTARHARAGSQ